MGKTPERRVFTSSGTLRYRRKVPDNQQPEAPPVDVKKEPPQQLTPQQESNSKSSSRSSRSPAGRRFRPKSRQPKQQQHPPLLKQLLWKAKAVQPTPAPPSSSNASKEPEDEEDEEAAFAAEQRKTRKLLAREAEAKAKKKAVAVQSETFVAESSSQETQSGSEEDEVVFLPYRNLPTTKWQVFKQQEDGSTDGEEGDSPVMPSETAPEQPDGLEKTSTRRKQRQKYKLKQKQKRTAAKEQKRRQHQQKQENEQSCVASTQGDEDAIFHPHTNLASENDEGVCRAVLSQLKDVVPFIVVGDVACPVVADDDEQPSANVSASDKDQVSDPTRHVAAVDFRQHVIALLDRSKETQMQYRDSFVMEESGFDAASSYDFFKHRFCEIQRSEGIVYY